MLRHRDFRLLLAVLVPHASPLQLGLVTAAGTVAFTVVGRPAGA
ncbi:hypothetical protein ACQP1P_32495 [Dactylosporangium sp. CA-052675]